jgi:1-aminocyclopropane-1-carboxylate deaminase/D-cysteine desulfhydrase-like pyridoxal-dependent ACC family enzyme
VIGRYPTDVELLRALSTRATSLYVKRDDRTSDVYGGNKVRKLERILDEATRRGARRLVTFGAAGSHHVLATTVHAARAGLRVAAVLAPQPHSAHAEANLRAALAWGLEPIPLSSARAPARVMASLLSKSDFVVAPGGSSVLGTLGYVDAAAELAEQIGAGVLPVPDVVVVALGSGGTAAGLLAGFAASGIATRIVAVRIVSALLAGPLRTVELAVRALRRVGRTAARQELASSLEVDGRWLGRGYGVPTVDAECATVEAAEQGIVLDPTYTAKAFAAALALARDGSVHNVLYWHTLAAQPQRQGEPLSPTLRRLFRP